MTVSTLNPTVGIVVTLRAVSDPSLTLHRRDCGHTVGSTLICTRWLNKNSISDPANFHLHMCENWTKGRETWAEGRWWKRTCFAGSIKTKHENPHFPVCKELAHDPADGAAHVDTSVDDQARNLSQIKKWCQRAQLIFS